MDGEGDHAANDASPAQPAAAATTPAPRPRAKQKTPAQREGLEEVFASMLLLFFEPTGGIVAKSATQLQSARASARAHSSRGSSCSDTATVATLYNGLYHRHVGNQHPDEAVRTELATRLKLTTAEVTVSIT
jgi:hypothetical protein